MALNRVLPVLAPGCPGRAAIDRSFDLFRSMPGAGAVISHAAVRHNACTMPIQIGLPILQDREPGPAYTTYHLGGEFVGHLLITTHSPFTMAFLNGCTLIYPPWLSSRLILFPRSCRTFTASLSYPGLQYRHISSDWVM